jgi:hypothetical protein
MPPKPLNVLDYTQWSALITNSVLIRSIETSYPSMTMTDQDQLIIDILDRIARIHGWSVRREPTMEETDGE